MDDDYELEYDDDDNEDGHLENDTHAKRQQRPKVKLHWSSDKILKLISLIKTEPCIWNDAYTGYSNKQLTKEAWSRVRSGFDSQYNEPEMHAKWNNLRIQYRLNRRKKRSTWKYFDALSFIGAASAAAVTHMYNSSLEDSNESTLDATSISGTATSTTTSTPVRRRTAPAPSMSANSSTLNKSPEHFLLHTSDRDEAMVCFLLSELRSLPESDANILRCRLQRTLLEFNEERQSNLSMSAVDFKHNNL